MCFIIFCPFFLPSCHSTLSPSSLPLFPLPPSLLPSLLSVLSPSPLPPFFFPSFSPFFFPSSVSPSSFRSSLPPFFLFFLTSLSSSLPPSLLPFLLSSLSSTLSPPPFFPPPSLFSSLSPSADVSSPETSSNSSRDSSLCARYYQVVVFQLIERSLLLPLHRLSACELVFFFVELYFTHSSFCHCHFFYSETVARSFSPFLESKRKKSPQFSVLFYPKFETLKLVKEKSNHRFPEGFTQ